MTKRRHSPDRNEADVVADMVLKLVSEVVRQSKEPHEDEHLGVEPTGVAVAPDMAEFVERRTSGTFGERGTTKRRAS